MKTLGVMSSCFWLLLGTFFIPGSASSLNAVDRFYVEEIGGTPRIHINNQKRSYLIKSAGEVTFRNTISIVYHRDDSCAKFRGNIEVVVSSTVSDLRYTFTWASSANMWTTSYFCESFVNSGPLPLNGNNANFLLRSCNSLKFLFDGTSTTARITVSAKGVHCPMHLLLRRSTVVVSEPLPSPQEALPQATQHKFALANSTNLPDGMSVDGGKTQISLAAGFLFTMYSIAGTTPLAFQLRLSSDCYGMEAAVAFDLLECAVTFTFDQFGLSVVSQDKQLLTIPSNEVNRTQLLAISNEIIVAVFHNDAAKDKRVFASMCPSRKPVFPGVTDIFVRGPVPDDCGTADLVFVESPLPLIRADQNEFVDVPETITSTKHTTLGAVDDQTTELSTPASNSTTSKPKTKFLSRFRLSWYIWVILAFMFVVFSVSVIVTCHLLNRKSPRKRSGYR